MSAAGQSAGAHARSLRAGARKGPWRKLLSAVGYTGHTRAADAQAARYELGGEWERVTARMLAPLTREGWHVLHDRRLPSGANLDHVLVLPSASGLVVLDTKRWDFRRKTVLRQGRVCCGTDDRHDEVEKVARYAATVANRLKVPVDVVDPLLVIHRSEIPGHFLAARVPNRGTPVYVLDPLWLLSTLRGGAEKAGPPNPRAAANLAHRVKTQFPPR